MAARAGRHHIVHRYQDVGEIDGKESIENLALKIAPAFVRGRWHWSVVGIPDAATLAGRLAQLVTFCGDSEEAGSGGLLVERRGDRYFLMLDKKLYALL